MFKRHTRTRKQRWYILLALLLTPFVFGGCLVTKSHHLKVTNALKKKLADLNKEKDGVQARLDQRNRDYTKMKADRDKQSKARKRFAKLLAEMRVENKNCNKQVRSLNGRITDLTQSRGALGSKLQKAFARIDELKKVAQQRKALFDRLRASFQTLVSAGKLKVRMVKGMLVLQLAEKILFGSGSASVKKAGREAIKEVTQILRAMNRRWQVTGHSDNRGNAKFNWGLSMRRAQAVLFVMLKNGMPPKDISAAGFGQFQPRAANDTNENRSLNRRTEIVLVPNLEELKLAQGPMPSQVCSTIKSLAQVLLRARKKS